MNKDFKWVGVDPGQQGYVAILGIGTDLVYFPLPLLRLYPNRNTRILDSKKFCDILKYNVPTKSRCHILIESVPRGSANIPIANLQPIAIQLGQLIAIMELECYPYTLIHPRSWQMQILGGGIAKGLTKQAAASVVWQRFPEIRNLSPRQLRECADSICLSLLSRRMFPTPESGVLEAAKPQWRNLVYIPERIDQNERHTQDQNMDTNSSMDGDKLAG